jgi:hypothetical protein
MKIRQLPLIAAALLSGCDIFYGVYRAAPLSSRPNLDCVKDVIEKTPGVAEVHYRHDEGGTTLTFKSPASIADSYFFRGPAGSHVLGTLQIGWNYPDQVVFTDTLRDLDRKPPQEDVDRSRPVMKLVEQRLESECGMSGLASKVKETCLGVQCS